MEAYVKPTFVSFGNSEKLIKGNCGWGSESWRLNKTNGRKMKRNRIVRQACNPNVSPGQIMCDVCMPRTVCGPSNNEC
ncbi:hypothetical protein [Virgibacillus chiguensis]|uniref:Uncharacterized protein n=1 Tax=Virgibacillus chiguensis TaxID=411959 RepID=A0A1M5TAU2_9BACI|nr:hypothetical protein [Virgibacillus chiguensis]SHH47796.1 hypothetical protein SAMN05421807_107173 [Virgibacillus chiguensis]